MQPLVNLCSAPIDGLTTLESGDPSQRNIGLFCEYSFKIFFDGRFNGAGSGLISGWICSNLTLGKDRTTSFSLCILNKSYLGLELSQIVTHNSYPKIVF